MAKRRAKSTTPAVLYLRCSTDEQTESIDGQRSHLEKFAKKHGYKIVGEYKDDGISGDEWDRRLGIRQLVNDAPSSEWRVVLCWDQDRLSRFDSMEASVRFKPLADAGVRVVTPNGEIDWSSMIGRISFSMYQELKHQFLRDLSRNVARGQAEAAKRGSWRGSPPYGYRIAEEAKDGHKIKRLVIHDEEADVVRKVFDVFLAGHSPGEVAKQLQAEGIPTARRASRWRRDAVLSMLRNPAYVGDYASGKGYYGKYWRTTKDGDVEVREGRRRNNLPPEEWTIIKNTHEPIIERALFSKVQRQLKAKRRRIESKGDYLFSGKLVCSKCGGSVNGHDRRKKKVYRCHASAYEGPEHCIGTRVNEDALCELLAESFDEIVTSLVPFDEMNKVVRKAKRGTLQPNDLGKGWAKLKRLVTGDRPKLSAKDTKRDEARLAKLEDEITTGIENLPFLPKQRIPTAERAIKKKEEQRDVLRRRLASVRTPAEEDSEVLRIFNSLVAYNANPDDPAVVRRLLTGVRRIVVHTKTKGEGKGTRHTLQSVEIEWGDDDTGVDLNGEREPSPGRLRAGCAAANTSVPFASLLRQRDAHALRVRLLSPPSRRSGSARGTGRRRAANDPAD